MDNIEAMPTAVNYALLEKALTAFEAAKKPLTIAQVALSPENQSRDTRETAVTLDCFAYYHPGPQEPQTYAKFLKLLNSGIFHLLPYLAYHRQMNNFQNRLSADVSELYPFPSFSEAKAGWFHTTREKLKLGFKASLRFGERFGEGSKSWLYMKNQD